MTSNDPRYVIVQAGGRGSRLGVLTANKPKCLLSVDGEPLLYRLFRQVPDAQFIVVTDTHADVLANYFHVVPPPVPVTLVHATGTGTLAGIAEAVDLVKEPDAPFLVLWCDLFFDDGLPDFAFGDVPVIGLSDKFSCRWSVDAEGNLVEVASDTHGVAGFFSFPNVAALPALPASGEFVRFLRDHGRPMESIVVPGIREFGTLAALSAYVNSDRQTRFFNEIAVGEQEVVKRSRVPEFDGLIEAEADWYEMVGTLGFPHVPTLRRRRPLTLDRVDGVHPFGLDRDGELQANVLHRIVDCLSRLHDLRTQPGDQSAVQEMYLHKTLDRVRRVRRLIPNLNEETLTVNGVRCRNPLHPRHESWLVDVMDAISVRDFTLIHGDPTFSNTLIGPDLSVWLIDPRGTFADHAFYGDPRYDWAKLLYSVEGNYDQFNRRRFEVRVDGSNVRLDIASNGWESQVAALHDHLRDVHVGSRYELETVHALIWLSLSGYVLDDVDSVLGAFYNGVAYLERAEK
ncbi:NTP transferase domain-containing protein [Micromonospora zamorensis]|uniref:NTP transferase domain-containing protein n=1 Tax=Micromonospora zamorensis TaxID=709883 RepID=UPI003D95CCAF